MPRPRTETLTTPTHADVYMTPLVGTHYVAHALGISSRTVARACDDGVIPSRRSPGGHRLVPLAWVREALRVDAPSPPQRWREWR